MLPGISESVISLRERFDQSQSQNQEFQIEYKKKIESWKLEAIEPFPEF